MANLYAPTEGEINLAITYEYTTIVALLRLWIANLIAQVERYTTTLHRTLGDPERLPADRAELEKLLRPGERLEQLEDGSYRAARRVARSRDFQYIVQSITLCIALITKALDSLEERAAKISERVEPCMCPACVMPQRPGPRMVRDDDDEERAQRAALIATAQAHATRTGPPPRLVIYASELQSLVQLLATIGVSPIVDLEPTL